MKSWQIFFPSIISIWSDSLISLLSKLQPNGLFPLNLKSPFTLILKAANVPGHNTKYVKQAGAELGKAQVKLEIMYEVIVESRSWKCGWNWSSTNIPGGWSDKTKVILNSTQFKMKLNWKLELSLAKVLIQGNVNS